MGTYRVAQGTQVHHEGVVYGQDESFTASPEQVKAWLAEGWVAAASTKVVHAPATEDKSKRPARKRASA